MEPDDVRPKADEPLRLLELEELDSLSLDELDERVRRLEAEIERARVMHKSKQASHLAAEAFFKS